MNPSPIARVLSILRRKRVRSLLMGGQACILYGAAEFTRDIDIAVAVGPENLRRLQAALLELRAQQVYFPALGAAVLRRGHACHFRCLAPGLRRVRLDVMVRMRGVNAFPALWKRRVRMTLSGAGPLDVLSLQDLVRAKKTQRDKDWPMIRRLVEADIIRAEAEKADVDRIRFWLLECRTADWLTRLAERFPDLAWRLATRRPLLRPALRGQVGEVTRLLRREEDLERERDRRYWTPLRKELERWRLERKG